MAKSDLAKWIVRRQIARRMEFPQFGGRLIAQGSGRRVWRQRAEPLALALQAAGQEVLRVGPGSALVVEKTKHWYSDHTTVAAVVTNQAGGILERTYGSHPLARRPRTIGQAEEAAESMRELADLNYALSELVGELPRRLQITLAGIGAGGAERVIGLGERESTAKVTEFGLTTLDGVPRLTPLGRVVAAQALRLEQQRRASAASVRPAADPSVQH